MQGAAFATPQHVRRNRTSTESVSVRHSQLLAFITCVMHMHDENSPCHLWVKAKYHIVSPTSRVSLYPMTLQSGLQILRIRGKSILQTVASVL